MKQITLAGLVIAMLGLITSNSVWARDEGGHGGGFGGNFGGNDRHEGGEFRGNLGSNGRHEGDRFGGNFGGNGRHYSRSLGYYGSFYSMFKLLFIVEVLILNNLLLINSKKLYSLSKTIIFTFISYCFYNWF